MILSARREMRVIFCRSTILRHRTDARHWQDARSCGQDVIRGSEEVAVWHLTKLFNWKGANSHLARSILEELFFKLKEVGDGVHPGLDAIATGFATSADGELRIKREGRSCVDDTIAYYSAQFNDPAGDYYSDMAVYEACELADPRRIVGYPEREVVRRLKNFIPLYDRTCSVPDSTITSLIQSLPAYKLNAGGVDCQLPRSFLARDVEDRFDMQTYWAVPANMIHFKYWVYFARSVMLIQTSSAAVERSFSALKRSIDSTQAQSMLADGQFVSVKMNVDKVIRKSGN